MYWSRVKTCDAYNLLSENLNTVKNVKLAEI